MNPQFGSPAHERPPLPCSAPNELQGNTKILLFLSGLRDEQSPDVKSGALTFFVFIPLLAAPWLN